MEWLTIPLTILALAFLCNGFNFVTINKYYDKEDEE